LFLLPWALGAKAPVDEEVYYPAPLASVRPPAAGYDPAGSPDLLGSLSSSQLKDDPALWAPREVEQAGGKNEVLAALSRTLMESDRFCARRSGFEAGVCRVARQESLDRAGRALIRAQDGRFVFVGRELERVKMIFKRTKRALFEVIKEDGRFTDDEKEALASRIVGVELSEYSFVTDPAQIKDAVERAEIQGQCLDRDGRYLVDNSFYWRGKIYLCPFHVAKAFAVVDEGRPEEVMIFNLAHLLAHSLAFDAFGKEVPKAYEKALGCYGSHFAGAGDPYGLKAPNTFRSETEQLCCRSTEPGEQGIRSCKETSEKCDVRPYMTELLADQWAYSALGRYIKREQDYSLGKVEKLPQFIAKQNRDMFAKNLYVYCDPASERRDGLDVLDAASLFVNPKMPLRLAEARKNKVLSKAIFCPFDAEAIGAEFGEVCWNPKIALADLPREKEGDKAADHGGGHGGHGKKKGKRKKKRSA
jgi:hypothetical protein